MDATMPASPAAMAAAAAAGSCGGRGQLFDKRLDSGAQTADGSFATHHRAEPVLQNQRGVEVLHLQEPLRGLLQGQLGNQSDDLARNRPDAVACGLAFDEFEDAVDRSLLE